MHTISYIHASGDEFGFGGDEYNHVFEYNEDEANDGYNKDKEYDDVLDGDDGSAHPSTSYAANNNGDDFY